MTPTWKKQHWGPAELICQWQDRVPAWQQAGEGWWGHLPGTALAAFPGKQHALLVTPRVRWSHCGPHLGRPCQTRMNFCWPGQIALVGLSQMVWRQHQGSCTLFC